METFCSDCFCFRSRDDQRQQTSSVSIHLLKKQRVKSLVKYSGAMPCKHLHVKVHQFVTDPMGKPQPVQIFLHNFSYAHIARQLHNEACSCTQDRLEIIVDVHRLIWKYTVTVIQSTVNYGSHKSMRSFLAQGVTNKTKMTITVP